MLSDVSQNPTSSLDPVVDLLSRASKAKELGKKYRNMAMQKRTVSGPQNVSINTPYGSGTVQIGNTAGLGLGSTNLSSSDGTQPQFVA